MVSLRTVESDAVRATSPVRAGTALWLRMSIAAGLICLPGCGADTTLSEPSTAASEASPNRSTASPSGQQESKTPVEAPALDTTRQTVPPAVTSIAPNSTINQASDSGDTLSERPATTDQFSQVNERVADLEMISFQLPALTETHLPDGRVDGMPFGTIGSVPASILVSTKDCEVSSIDSMTGEATPVWTYNDVSDLYFDCEDVLEERPSGMESFPSHIDDVEWISPSLVLVSICCEPAAGRFEVIDTSAGSQPAWLALNGSFPSINSQNVLLHGTAVPIGTEAPVIRTVPFEIQYDQSDPDYPYYSLKDPVTFYSLSFGFERGSEDSSERLGYILGVGWVGDDKIGFELWSNEGNSHLYPSVGIVDLELQSVVVRSRGPGWMIPTGDDSENLVVAEQACRRIGDSCEAEASKIVVLDSTTLMPIHEVTVDRAIADMDMVRGWLIVTFSDGRMGTINLIDGSFSAVADGIVNAVWME